MGKRKGLVYWNIPVTKTLDEAVEEAVRQDMHVSKSDLIRDAVRRLLQKINVDEAITLAPKGEAAKDES